jgi:hypothetical protein
MNTAFRPRPWTAAEAQDDSSWTLRLSPEAAEGFHQALLHAKATGKGVHRDDAGGLSPAGGVARRPDAGDRPDAGPLGHVPGQGPAQRPLDRGRSAPGQLGLTALGVTCISRAAPARLPVRSTASRVAKKDSFISFSSLPVAEMWLYTRGGRPQNS